MILYPAIDISEGQAVRLVKGDFAEKTVYRDSPVEAARAWVEAGARFLHVVDLDGARTGSPKSLDHLERITHELSVPVQYGGGLRSLPAVRDALRAGAERVILGTAAFTDIDFLDDVLGAFRERVIVSVDTRGGNVSTSGWQQTTQMPADERHRPPPAPRRAVVRVHERRPRRDAPGPRPRRGPPDRGRRARALPVLGRDRLDRRPARSRRRCARSTSAA